MCTCNLHRHNVTSITNTVSMLTKHKVSMAVEQMDLNSLLPGWWTSADVNRDNDSQVDRQRINQPWQTCLTVLHNIFQTHVTVSSYTTYIRSRQTHLTVLHNIYHTWCWNRIIWNVVKHLESDLKIFVIKLS